MNKKPAKILEKYQATNSKLHVMVLMGGESNEREVSLSSGKGVVESLKRLNYTVTAMDMGYDIAKYILEMNPDVVFIALHGPFGEDGKVQGLLDVMRIPYTHSGVLPSAIALNKEFSYNILKETGINLPQRQIVDITKIKESPIPKPYVIKPIHEGSSIGVNIVFEKDNYSLTNYVEEYGNKFGEKIIIEQYIPGREIQVAIVNNKAIGAVEIKTNRRFYDYIAKYTPGQSEHIIPPAIKKEKYQEVMDIAEKIHNILMCDGISRVDFRYNDNPEVDKFYFLEVNTHPGFTPTSLVPEIAAYNNIGYDTLIETLVRAAKCYSVTTNI